MPGYILLFNAAFTNGWGVDTTLHEMGHILDLREYRKSVFNAPWSWGLITATGGTCKVLMTVICIGYQPHGTTPGYGASQPVEDFAESFRVWVFTNTNVASSKQGGSVDQARLNYIAYVVSQY
jgi:hypothetical protein